MIKKIRGVSDTYTGYFARTEPYDNGGLLSIGAAEYA